MVTPEDILLSAANYTSALVQHENFAKLVTRALKMCGLSLLSYIEEDDTSGLLVPLERYTNGRWENGCILTLQDRAVIAWWTGTLRIKHFFQVVPYDTIAHVTTGETTPATGLVPKKITLEIAAEENAVIRIMQLSAIPAWVMGVLLGGITFGEGDTAA